MIRYLAITATLAMLPMQALSMQKCVDDQGNITFTDDVCPPGTKGKFYQPSNETLSIGSGLRPGERALLRDVQAKQARELQRRNDAWEHEKRHRLTYSDRKRLRELEMKKGNLSWSLNHGSKSWSEKLAIQRQIQGIDRQIEKIQSPKY